MEKTAAFCLVVVVLLAGAAGPGLALQGGPPDHANDDGNGPPDHANDGGADGADDDEAEGGDGETASESDDDDDGPPDDGGSDVEDDGDGERGDEGDDADDDADAGGDDDADAGGDDDDAGVLPSVDDAVDDDDDGDDGDATATSTDRATSTEPGESETPTNPVGPVLQIFDTPEDTPEPTAQETPGETDESTSQDPDPLPDPRETETPTPTPEPTETPRETREETPESTPEPTATPASDDGGDDDAGSSAARSEPEPTATPSEPSVEVDTGDDVTRASVEDVRAGRAVEVPLRGPATDGEGVAVEAVDVGVESGAPFTLTVTRPTAEGDGEPAPGVPVGYFDVETDHDDVGNATLTVAVDEAALPAGVAAGDLDVMRYADGEWESTETAYDESAGVYTAETAGFSQFALAAPGDGPLQVTDVEVDEDGDGEEATVRASVENSVDRQASGTVAVTVDGETVETRELTLGGDETATVTFDLPAERFDGETVAVDGVEAGTLQIQETEPETAAGSIDGNLAFGVGAAAFLVLSAVGTGLLAARSDEWDWER